MDNQIYYNILSNIDEGIYFVNNEREITFWNKGAEQITGFSSKEVLGKHCYDNILNHIDEEGNQLCMGNCPLYDTINDGKPRSIFIYLNHKNGNRIPVNARSIQIIEDGKVMGAVEMFKDNSEYQNISKNLQELSEIALHDQLTTLPNRRYFESFVQSKFSEYRQLRIQFGLIFIDLDHFKKINDTYGHQIGDDMLKIISKTMLAALRSTDLIARYGGEEFVAVIQVDTLNKLSIIAEKLRVLVYHTLLTTIDPPLYATISIGVTMVNEKDTIDSIVKRADQLMYKSKADGRNRVTSE